VTAIAPPTVSQVFSDQTLFTRTFALKIRDDNHQIVPLRYKPAQLDFMHNMAHRNLILKARQLGFSTFMQARLYWKAVTRPISTLTLGHDQSSTDKMRRMANTFQENMPPGLAPTRKKDSAAIAIYTETGSEATIATAGNKTSGRSMTFGEIHASEAAYYPDAYAILSGAMEAGNPIITLESTANGAQGFFYEKCMAARDGDPEWALHFYAWWWDQKYALALDYPDEIIIESDSEEERLVQAHGLSLEQIKWRRWKRKSLGNQFLQEYPEDPVSCFLLSGQGFFGGLDKVFEAPTDATPQEGHQYFAGIDWGKTDYTVLSIGDATTKQQVYLGRWHKMDWPTMRSFIIEACKRWNVELIAAESNSIGDPNISELRYDLENIMGFNTNANTKGRALSGLHIAMNENGWKFLPDKDQINEHRAYEAKQTASGAWTYSAPSGQHDDTVIANMLMIYASIQGSILVPGMS
jgi:hypothetical protein